MTQTPFSLGAVQWRALSRSRAVELVGAAVSSMQRAPARFSAGMFLSLALASAVGAADNQPDQTRPKSTPIVRLSADMMAGKGLERMGALPKDMRISGAEPAFLSTWFEGQISSQMLAVADGVIRLSKSPFDEVVVVLNGSITVTPRWRGAAAVQEGRCVCHLPGLRGHSSIPGRLPRDNDPRDQGVPFSHERLGRAYKQVRPTSCPRFAKSFLSPSH
jgi:hypothetical protein